MLDLAPTILERFGYPIPPDMRGRPLLEPRPSDHETAAAGAALS
jgi:hypothetical protein